MWPIALARLSSPLYTAGRRQHNIPHTITPFVSVQEHTLVHYLPAFAQSLPDWDYDVDALVDQLIAASPELRPRTTWNPLEKDELREKYEWIIRAISRSSSAEVELDVSSALMDRLDEHLSRDRADRRRQNTQLSQRSQHLFRCLAEISRQTKSVQIGRVLVAFFVRNAAYLATHDSNRALGQWCYAVLRAKTSEGDRFECLRRVVRERPDLAVRLRAAGWKGGAVAEQLDLVATHMQRHEIESVQPDWLHLVRPRRQSRERDSLFLLDRDRDHDHDRDWERIESDDLILEAERMMRAQEVAARQSRRVLQLTMGRHHDDRLDHFLQDADSLSDDAFNLALADHPLGI